jgi:hypothetical protein
MKHGFVVAAATALAISAPAFAQSPIQLHRNSSAYPELMPATQPVAEVAQAQVPAYPPAAPSITVPLPPPAAQSEIPPPAPLPSYVWELGHWSWNGVQYIWEPGKYVERPTVSATFVPGYWEPQGNGWVWVEGRWDYPGVGSSKPPTAYLPAR